MMSWHLPTPSDNKHGIAEFFSFLVFSPILSLGRTGNFSRRHKRYDVQKNSVHLAWFFFYLSHGGPRLPAPPPPPLACLTCPLSPERKQVLNRLENTKKSTKKNAKLSNSNIIDILLFRTRIILFKSQKFCLMLFKIICFKLIPIQNA